MAVNAENKIEAKAHSQISTLSLSGAAIKIQKGAIAHIVVAAEVIIIKSVKLTYEVTPGDTAFWLITLYLYLIINNALCSDFLFNLSLARCPCHSSLFAVSPQAIPDTAYRPRSYRQPRQVFF